MPDAEARFWAKVDKAGPNGCWEWTAYRSADGYGRANLTRSRPENAHRIAYRLLVGPIPDGMTIDHLCRNRGCVNPAHLEAVTNRVNVLRGVSVVAERARKTHCPKGHAYEGTNLGIDRLGHRYCKACRLSWYHANKKLGTSHHARLAESRHE